jgi:glycosyltransferase involved in cell wall biosynthesis
LVLTSTFPRWLNDAEPPFVYELTRRLTGQFEITVLAPRAPGALEQEQLGGIRVMRFPYCFRSWETLATYGGGILNRLRTNRLYYLLVPLFLLGQCWTLARTLRREPFDALHAHWLIPQGLSALLARWLARRPVPMLCTSHGGDLFALRSAPMRFLKRGVMQRSRRITVVSAAMRDEVLRVGIDPEKVEVVPMGVDMRNIFTPDPRIERSETELLFVGRLVEKKGLHLLLRAMPEILRHHSNARLTVAGDGPLDADLRRLADELEIGTYVDFLGMTPQSELPHLYRRATLLAVPFLVASTGDQEGFPLVPLEAIGCECPLVCGHVAAFGDIIRHEREAMLVPPGDSDALAAAIIDLISNPEKRARLARNGRIRCHNAFDWGTIAKRYSDLLSDVLNTSREAESLHRG